MSIEHAVFYVDGMTCPACESRVLKALTSLPGLLSVKVRLQGGVVHVGYDPAVIGLPEIKEAVVRTGYSIREAAASGSAIPVGIGLVLVVAYLVADRSGLFSSFPVLDSSIGYAMLFVIGLLTSIHCIAMCGGIALSQSLAPNGESPPNRWAALKPGLLYNAGRIVSYTVIGGLIGALGSVFNFSPFAKGLIAAIAGLFMVIFGLRMIGLLQFLPRIFRFLPIKTRGQGPLVVGLLNGLMPCGPLQTMQLYALGTGSALSGALSMLAFSAGTVPLMLVFGLTAAMLPRKFVPVMMKASAVLVMFLGVVTFARAAALAGMPLPFGDKAASFRASGPGTVAAGMQVATVSDGFQSIVTEFTARDYVPFAVQAGIPLRWTIRISAEDLNGCNRTLVIPAYDITKDLVAGDNLIEFTPISEGTISYSCWMGMITSAITVSGSPVNPLALSAQSAGAVREIGFPVIKDGVQTITVTVSAAGYSPSAIVMQKGMNAIIRFKVAELTACNRLVDFPEFNGRLDLEAGQLETPPIPVTADFNFQCGMTMIHGYVKAVDDLSRVDIEKIQKEIAAIPVTAGCGGGGCCGAR